MSMKTLALSAILSVLSPSVFAFDLNDCIINGMKGVSNDTAARQIRNACDQKSKEEKRKVLEKLSKEYGDIIDNEFFHNELRGDSKARYRNESNDKVITFVRLAVWPRPDGAGTPCQPDGRTDYFFKPGLKPRGFIQLDYPFSTPTDCRAIWAVMGRTSTWTDISLFSSVSPIDRSPFSESEFNLDILYGPAPLAPTLPKSNSDKNDSKFDAHSADHFIAAIKSKNKTSRAQQSIYIDPRPSVELQPKQSLANAIRN